jgi:hypothetical protein
MPPMRRSRRSLALAVLAVAIAGCAAPSRRLTTRVVEDPITLPKRLASGSLRMTAIHYEPTDAQGVLWGAGIRLGITDRLEWTDVLSLRYAILDDRPADGRAPKPFSLALRAGLLGIGYSSMDGMIVLPIISLDVLKHVADRWALSLGAQWHAQWIQHPYTLFPFTPSYSSTLHYSARIFSTVSVNAAVTRQLSPRVALGIAPSVAQNTDCVEPTCDWKWQSASVALVLSVRPLWWLTARVAPGAGVRHRADLFLPVVYPDGTAIPIRPHTVTFGSLTAWLDFYW